MGMLGNDPSLRDGIHNACYMPQAMGVCHGRSDSTGSDVHRFENPLYHSYDQDSQSHDQDNQSHGQDSLSRSSHNYSYPVFRRDAMNGNQTGSVHSDSGVYSTVNNHPVQLTIFHTPDRLQAVARDDYETIDFDHRV